VLAGAVYLGGAIVTELSTVLYEQWLGPGIVESMLTALEEFLEMCGIILFIYTLLDYIQSQMQDLKMAVEFK
jgi:hypothetical protein